MNSILFVTLARGGSKGVPGKHVRMLGDKTVLEWTIDAVKRSHYYSGNYVISSDDQDILDIAKKNHVHWLERPEELARDDTPTLPALQHAVRTMERNENREYEYIVEVRATSPFKIAEDIDCVVAMIRDSWPVDPASVIGVTPLEDHHPARAKWLDSFGLIQDFIPEPESGRRQDCQPPAYIRNGTLYALKRDAVMGQGAKLFGHEESLAYVMSPERSINIDTEMDWMLCQLMYQKMESDRV